MQAYDTNLQNFLATSLAVKGSRYALVAVMQSQLVESVELFEALRLRSNIPNSQSTKPGLSTPSCSSQYPIA